MNRFPRPFWSRAVLGTGLLLASMISTPLARAESKGERLNVEKLKEKYWQHGDEVKTSVVQNRLYTKGGKIEFGAYYAAVSTDPFLSVKGVGGHFGIHFNEYLALGVQYWKDTVVGSEALTEFERANGFTVNTNNPKSFMGAEIAISPIYGKLSVFGKAIVYYDLHLTAGAGYRDTESGKYVAPIIGIGQQIYLTRFMSLRADYKIFRFDEVLLEKVRPDTLGQPLGSPRTNTSSVVTMGIDFLVGLF